MRRRPLIIGSGSDDDAADDDDDAAYDDDAADDEDSELLVGLWSGLDPLSKGCVLMLALALASLQLVMLRQALGNP